MKKNKKGKLANDKVEPMPEVTQEDSEKRHYYSEQHGQAVVWPGFRDLYQQGKLLDMTLVAEGQSFKVHRCYLAACSQYFSSMFTGGFSEGQEGKVTMEGVTAEGLRAVINFMYTGRVELNPDKIATVLEAASHTQMWNLQKLCEQYMIEELSVHNCLKFLKLSEMYSLESINDKVMINMLSKFTELGETEDFLTISEDLLCELMASDNLDADELKVFNIAVSWLKYKPERIARTPEVLGHIRFGLMAPEEMELVHSNLTDDDLLFPHCRQLLKTAVKYHMNIFKQPLLKGPIAKPRLCTDSLLLIGGRTEEFSSHDIFATPVDAISFESVGKLRWPLIGAQAAVLNNFVYIIGGEANIDDVAGEHSTNAAFRYNPVDGKWLSICCMDTARSYFALVVFQDSLVALCGVDNRDKSLKTVERYDLGQNRWTYMPSFPFILKGHASCVHNNCIYVSGGKSKGITSLLYCYDGAKDEWQEKSRMNERRKWHSMVANYDCLFVCGGFTSLGPTFVASEEVEMYDIKTDQWSHLAPIPTATFLAARACRNNCVYILGGQNTEGELMDAIQCYDMKKNQWIVMDPTLPVQVCCSIAVFVKIPGKSFQYGDHI